MRAARTDRNQKEIVSLFRDLGCNVAITSSVGDGFPDIVVQRSGTTYLVEIKDPEQPPSRRRLTKSQQVFHSIFHCYIVETREDVFTLLGALYD